jgi:hypothetical protein
MAFGINAGAHLVAAFGAAIKRWRMHIMAGSAEPFGDKAPNPTALISPVDQNNARHIVPPAFVDQLSAKPQAWKAKRGRAGRMPKAG